MQNQVKPTTIHKLRDGALSYDQPDLLAVEEPLEIRIGYGPENDRSQKSISVTMRTPGHDHELALGFLFSEGIIHHFQDVEGIRHCEDVGKEETGNIVRVELKPDLSVDFKKIERHFYTTSSCGVCGKSSLDAISVACSPIDSTLSIPSDLINAAPKKLSEAQAVFAHTGGIHATGLFDDKGQLLMLREDVGRHNAFDKVIGGCLMKNMLPLNNHFAVVSGRASFELVQKAVMAQAPIMVAVGAPSSLAVDLADKFKQTLIGFAKNDRFNIYCGDQRIESKQ